MTEAGESYNVPRGAAYFTSQQAITYLTSFLFYVLLARILTRSEIGQISLLAAALAVFNTLTQLALPATATRYISSHLGAGQSEPAGAVARTTLRLTLATGLFGAIAAIAVSPFIGQTIFNTPDATPLLVTTFLAGLVLDLTTLYGAYFLGAGLYAKTVYQNILYVPLSRALGLVLASLGLRVLGIVIGWTIGGVATLLLSLYFWRNHLPTSASHPARPLLVFALPLFASTLISLGIQWGDIALLQTILGQLSTTGAYYIVVSSVGFLSVLWIPVSSALYPALSASSATNPQGVKDRVSLALRLTNLAVLPLATALAAVSATALEIAYGPAYAAEAVPFAILTLTSIFTAQVAILTVTLQAVGKTRSLLAVTFLATIIDLATVALTARLLGPTAGALGRGLLYFTTVLLCYRALRSTVHINPISGIREASLLAAGVGLPLLVVDQVLAQVTGVTALLRLPVLLVVFTGSFLAVGRRLQIFKPGDFSILKDALPRRLHPYLRTIEQLIL